MKRGELDLPGAKAFVEWTEGLADSQAARVCDHLIPDAGSLTVGELIDQIKRPCLAVDPDWAEKKYRKAVRARRVAGYRNPDGTATLVGQNEPLDRVAAACARIDALARDCKHAGDGRRIDNIRSDLFLGMTDGTFETFSDQQIIAHVLAHPYIPDRKLPFGWHAVKDRDKGFLVARPILAEGPCERCTDENGEPVVHHAEGARLRRAKLNFIDGATFASQARELGLWWSDDD